uniref:Cadherin domain-containing protein n=1 Tax=Knipowitschia caucasica TaxID=637954 RepID=A0AAV2MDE0_KNICA
MASGRRVESNDANALYRLVQKERSALNFPFSISVDGDIQLTQELDREDKDGYILVVFAEDQYGNQLDPPMEIQVIVEDVNDNEPQCELEENVFEIQEDELVGSLVGQLLAHDADEEGTLNAQLMYSIASQSPAPSSSAFSIDPTSGQIRTLKTLSRQEAKVYQLSVTVSDPAYSTECKVIIKVIDVNNKLPLFEKKDGRHGD